MARTKASVLPAPRKQISTRTSHTGPFVRVTSSPATGPSSATSSQVRKRDRSDSNPGVRDEHTKMPYQGNHASEVARPVRSGLVTPPSIEPLKRVKSVESGKLKPSLAPHAKNAAHWISSRDVKKTPSSRSTAQSNAKKKVRRFRPGTVALREIRHYQKHVDSVIPRAPMQRLVRDLVEELLTKEGRPQRDSVRFRTSALLALREGMEHWTIRALECTNLAAFHGRRITIMPKDLALIRRVKSM